MEIPSEAYRAAYNASFKRMINAPDTAESVSRDAVQAAAPIIARAAQVAILRELLTSTSPMFDRAGSNAVEVQMIDPETVRDMLTELDAGAGQEEVRDGG
jgi:hypothetical protein